MFEACIQDRNLCSIEFAVMMVLMTTTATTTMMVVVVVVVVNIPATSTDLNN